MPARRYMEENSLVVMLATYRLASVTPEPDRGESQVTYNRYTSAKHKKGCPLWF